MKIAALWLLGTLAFAVRTEFKDSGESPDQIKRFLTVNTAPGCQPDDDPDVFVAGFTVPYGGLVPAEVSEFDVSSWRYVSFSPANDPGKFDLWIQVKPKPKHRTVSNGNWKVVSCLDGSRLQHSDMGWLHAQRSSTIQPTHSPASA